MGDAGIRGGDIVRGGERVWVMIFPIVFVVRPQFEETDLMALTKCVWAQWET